MIRPPYPLPHRWDEVSKVQSALGEHYWLPAATTSARSVAMVKSRNELKGILNSAPAVVEPAVGSSSSSSSSPPAASGKRSVEATAEEVEEEEEEYEVFCLNDEWTERFAATIARMESKNGKGKKVKKAGNSSKKQKREVPSKEGAAPQATAPPKPSAAAAASGNKYDLKYNLEYEIDGATVSDRPSS